MIFILFALLLLSATQVGATTEKCRSCTIHANRMWCDTKCVPFPNDTPCASYDQARLPSECTCLERWRSSNCSACLNDDDGHQGCVWCLSKSRCIGWTVAAAGACADALDTCR